MGRREQECLFGSLGGSGTDKAPEKFCLYFGEIKELYSEAISVKEVCDLALERHRQSICRRYMNGHHLSDYHLHDGVDVASTGADIADPRRAASGGEVKFYFSQVCITVLFTGHIALGEKAR